MNLITMETHSRDINLGMISAGFDSKERFTSNPNPNPSPSPSPNPYPSPSPNPNQVSDAAMDNLIDFADFDGDGAQCAVTSQW